MKWCGLRSEWIDDGRDGAGILRSIEMLYL